MWRSGGEEIESTAVARAGNAAPTASSVATSCSERVAPRVRSPPPLAISPSSAIRMRLTTVSAVWWRRFMLGQRSVPPATSRVPGPSEASMSAASASVAGMAEVEWGEAEHERLDRAASAS